jgi:hypothetical protein
MDQVEAALTGDDAVVEKVVREHIPTFAGLGFAFTGFTVGGSPKLQRFPIFHFFNKRTGQRIDISFLAARAGLNGGFGVLIVAPRNRKLDVEDYLKRHKLEEPTRAFTYRDPETDVRSFATVFLKVLIRLFETELKPVIDGKTFEETPIDWMGYR